jgi:hypothetical protein
MNAPANEINTITLEKAELTYLWAVGILNDVAYVAFALQVDKRTYQSMKTLNIAAFSERWLFAGDENGVSGKILKPKQIRDAIHKLAKEEIWARSELIRSLQVSGKK